VPYDQPRRAGITCQSWLLLAQAVHAPKLPKHAQRAASRRAGAPALGLGSSALGFSAQLALLSCLGLACLALSRGAQAPGFTLPPRLVAHALLGLAFS
jgi:hypothetical protein